MSETKYRKILLTGSSGNLGSHIVNSGLFQNLLTPSPEELDITKPETVEKFFDENEVDAVINCAALARMGECEKDPAKAIDTNIVGTANLVSAVIKKEKIRFVHISTDGVYHGDKGKCSETDVTIPYNVYGWTKLGAECAVRTLSNFCILRTQFFDTKNIKFDTAATDAYSSQVSIEYFVKSIATMLENDFIGVINIGGERKSEYERYKEFKPSIRPCKLQEILDTIPFALAKDASMDCSLWQSIEKEAK